MQAVRAWIDAGTNMQTWVDKSGNQDIMYRFNPECRTSNGSRFPCTEYYSPQQGWILFGQGRLIPRYIDTEANQAGIWLPKSAQTERAQAAATANSWPGSNPATQSWLPDQNDWRGGQKRFRKSRRHNKRARTKKSRKTKRIR